MKTPLTAAGIILLLMGLVFMGQGSGYFPYPPSSFMISRTEWVFYGGVTAAAGLLFIIVARR